MKDVFRQTRLGRMHLRVHGTGRPLFLMHSIGTSAHEFDQLAAELGDDFEIVAWDMPGHGDSDPMRGHITVSEYADLALELVQSMFEQKPIVGGTSIGAMFAVAFGAKHPEAAAGILPIELPLGRDENWWSTNWLAVETMFSFPDGPEENTRVRFRDWSPELALRLRIDRHRSGGRTIMDALWAGRDDADEVPGWITALRGPTLFINGDRGVAPNAATMLDELNPDVKLTIIPDSQHFPQTDDPPAVARAIRDWVKTAF